MAKKLISDTFEVANRRNKTMSVHVHEVPDAKGVALIHHGLGGSSASPVIVRVKNQFNEAEFSTIVPDTTNNVNMAAGDIADFTFAGHAQDLQDVFDWARDAKLNRKGVHVVGYSLGGYSATKILEARAGIKSALLIAPMFSQTFYEEGMEASLPGVMAYWEQNDIGFTNDLGVEFSAPYMPNPEGPSDAFGARQINFKGPVSIVRAEQDLLVFDAHIRAARKAFAKAQLHITTLNSETHFFNQVPLSLENAVWPHIRRCMPA